MTYVRLQVRVCHSLKHVKQKRTSSSANGKDVRRECANELALVLVYHVNAVNVEKLIRIDSDENRALE